MLFTSQLVSLLAVNVVNLLVMVLVKIMDIMVKMLGMDIEFDSKD